MPPRRLISDSQVRRVQSKGDNKLPLSFDQLDEGYEFSSSSFDINSSFVSKYLEAVDRQEEQDHLASGFAPPLAIVARVMTELSKSLELPPGSIHASQELEFFKLVPVGAAITCRSRVAQKLNRGKLRLLAIELDALNQDEEKVLSGKATLILPG